MLTGPLRAPAADGGILAVPPLAEAGHLIAANRQRREAPESAAPGTVWDGLSWQALADLARTEVVREAVAYLARRGEPAPQVRGNTILVAGHQPDLFHPGVWVKNFALCGLARRVGAIPLNLIVDSDTLESPSLRVPVPLDREGGKSLLAVSRRIPYDALGTEMPWEERAVVDGAVFTSFGERAGALVRRWGFEPILSGFWPRVLEQAQRINPPLLGECFAASRRELERSWGCHNLEVPTSAVCRTEAFGHFARHLLADLERFQEAYNDAVHEYRERNHLRSLNHPVPDLQREDGWLEAPFWGWRPGQARRGRLFLRLLPDRTSVRASGERWPDLPPIKGGEFLTAWRRLEGQGLKVRGRALITTLFARLFLGELFIHGIGGGKYDELTDDLIRTFYRREAPAYMVLSATLRLPLPTYPVTIEDRRRLIRSARDVHWNPQRFAEVQADPALAELVRQKEEWIAQQPRDQAGRQERFRALQDLTARLRAPLQGREEALRKEQEQVERQLEANAVLRSREYSFCLFPEGLLRPFCTRFL